MHLLIIIDCDFVLIIDCDFVHEPHGTCSSLTVTTLASRGMVAPR